MMSVKQPLNATTILHYVICDFCVCDVSTLQYTLENEDKMFAHGKNIL